MESTGICPVRGGSFLVHRFDTKPFDSGACLGRHVQVDDPPDLVPVFHASGLVGYEGQV